MNTYELTIHTEEIQDSTTVEAETPEAAETAGYEWFDINYHDHRDCHEFSVEVVLVDGNIIDADTCIRCGNGRHATTDHVYMSNADYSKAKA